MTLPSSTGLASMCQVDVEALLAAPFESNTLTRWERKKSTVKPLSAHKSAVWMGNEPKTPCSSKPTMRAGPRTPARSINQSNVSALQSKTPKSYSDRFIPSRDAHNADYHMLNQSMNDENMNTDNRGTPSRVKAEHTAAIAKSLFNTEELNSKILTFQHKAPKPTEHHQQNLRVLYTQNKSEQHGVSRVRPITRHIPTAPERVLDAPDMCDDFYVNLLDWSATNLLAVALGPAVYLWDAASGNINHLCELNNPADMVTSVQFMQDGSHLAIGTASATNEIQLWNIENQRQVRSLKGHEARVGSLAWNGAILSSGSRDTNIIHHDVRIGAHKIAQLSGHSGEVCGLKWNPEGTQLASGSNDNQALIWDVSSTSSGMNGCAPRFVFADSCAAVKALAWCPFQRNTLATGGGTADRHIRFYNTSTGLLLNQIDTQSQVTSLQWSKTERELVSSHGHSNNHLSVWKFPSLVKLADLEGHTSRVLHTAVSPDGTSVVSAGADETIRFWKVWDSVGKKSGKFDSLSNVQGMVGAKPTIARRSGLTSSLR